MAFTTHPHHRRMASSYPQTSARVCNDPTRRIRIDIGDNRHIIAQQGCYSQGLEVGQAPQRTGQGSSQLIFMKFPIATQIRDRSARTSWAIGGTNPHNERTNADGNCIHHVCMCRKCQVGHHKPVEQQCHRATGTHKARKFDEFPTALGTVPVSSFL